MKDDKVSLPQKEDPKCYDLGIGEMSLAQEELPVCEQKKLLRRIDLKYASLYQVLLALVN